MDINNAYIFDGQFGIERETLRVRDKGEMAKTPHPFKDNGQLSRDFCENQLEIITPVCKSIDKLMSELERLDYIAKVRLEKMGEYLWMCSNPPHILSDEDIVPAVFDGDMSFKRDYRLNLERRYGKRLMLYSGIHFNFSFSEKFIQSIFTGEENYAEFKNKLYLKLFKQLFKYGWLLVLLSAASPVYDLSLDGGGLSGSGFDGYGSRRSGDKGYWNEFMPVLDYTDLYKYVKSVENYIEKGALFSEGELYLPVRLKPAGKNSLNELKANGIDHIELRMFDLNPLAEHGIFRTDLEFAHYFMIYLLHLPDFELTGQMQADAVRHYKEAARYDISEIMIGKYSIKSAALGLMDDMEQYFKSVPKVLRCISVQKRKITENKRYCTEIYNKLIGDFQNTMLDISKKGGDGVCASYSE